MTLNLIRFMYRVKLQIWAWMLLKWLNCHCNGYLQTCQFSCLKLSPPFSLVIEKPPTKPSLFFLPFLFLSHTNNCVDAPIFCGNGRSEASARNRARHGRTRRRRRQRRRRRRGWWSVLRENRSPKVRRLLHSRPLPPRWSLLVLPPCRYIIFSFFIVHKLNSICLLYFVDLMIDW